MINYKYLFLNVKGKGSNTEATFGIFFLGHYPWMFPNPKHWQEGPQHKLRSQRVLNSVTERSVQPCRSRIQESVPAPLC